MKSEEGNREGRAGEHMNLKISIGSQDFAFLREHRIKAIAFSKLSSFDPFSFMKQCLQFKLQAAVSPKCKYRIIAILISSQKIEDCCRKQQPSFSLAIGVIVASQEHRRSPFLLHFYPSFG